VHRCWSAPRRLVIVGDGPTADDACKRRLFTRRLSSPARGAELAIILPRTCSRALPGQVLAAAGMTRAPPVVVAQATARRMTWHARENGW
jgi:hypothetical protein